MTSATTEPPTLRSLPSLSAAAAASHRRSYSCYNCNYSFHISPTPSTSSASPSSFRCPCCHHRHLIPHHTISPPPPPPPPLPPPPSPPPSPPLSTLLRRNSDYASDSNILVYQSDDETDSDEDYDSDNSLLSFTSDNSLLSFTTPSFHSSRPALKSFVASLPIKNLSPNSTLPLQSCSICMEDFEINPKTSVEINELPCEHYFHKDCIVEWLQRSNTCPLCRYKLPVDPHDGQRTAPARNQWEVEYDAVLVVGLAQLREPPLLGRVDGERGVDEEESLDSNAASIGSDRPISNVNVGDIAGLDLDVMHDEDGDTLMVDA